MTERRAHWSDDLIDAVFRIMDDYAAKVRRGEWDPHGTPTFDVIATVEDWQTSQDVAGDWGTVAWSVRMYNHWVMAEATEARVRELHKPRRASSGRLVCSANCDADIDGQTAWPCPTIRAIEGEL